MISINITEETHTTYDMADMLEHVARQIRSGVTSGVYPSWSLDGSDDESN